MSQFSMANFRCKWWQATVAMSHHVNNHFQIRVKFRNAGVPLWKIYGTQALEWHIYSCVAEDTAAACVRSIQEYPLCIYIYTWCLYTLTNFSPSNRIWLRSCFFISFKALKFRAILMEVHICYDMIWCVLFLIDVVGPNVMIWYEIWFGFNPLIRFNPDLAWFSSTLILLETARMNNLSLNPDKIQFKSTDCKFFGHRLTPEGLKPDPEKIKSIIIMRLLQSIQQLISFNGMVNHLKRFNPVLSKFAEPLRKLQKSDTVWAWEFEQQTAFEKTKTALTTLPILAYFNKDKGHIIQNDIQDWTQCSLVTRRLACSLCIQNSNRHRVQIL